MATVTKEQAIKAHIKPGVYLRSELKNMIEEAYEKHQVVASAKASDASLVFKTKPTTKKVYRGAHRESNARMVAAIRLCAYD